MTSLWLSPLVPTGAHGVVKAHRGADLRHPKVSDHSIAFFTLVQLSWLLVARRVSVQGLVRRLEQVGAHTCDIDHLSLYPTMASCSIDSSGKAKQ